METHYPGIGSVRGIALVTTYATTGLDDCGSPGLGRECLQGLVTAGAQLYTSDPLATARGTDPARARVATCRTRSEGDILLAGVQYRER